MSDYDYEEVERLLAQSPLILSDSSLTGVWEKCKRKLEFHKFYFSSRGGPDHDQAVGHAMHKAWQVWITEKDEQKTLETLIRAYPADLTDTMYRYDDRKFYDATKPKSIESCYATTMEIMGNERLSGYAIANIVCIDGETRPAVEVEFCFDLVNNDGSPFTINGRKVFYIGFIDAIMFDTLTGDYVVKDLKTTSWKLEDATPQ